MRSGRTYRNGKVTQSGDANFVHHSTAAGDRTLETPATSGSRTNNRGVSAGTTRCIIRSVASVLCLRFATSASCGENTLLRDRGLLPKGRGDDNKPVATDTVRVRLSILVRYALGDTNDDTLRFPRESLEPSVDRKGGGLDLVLGFVAGSGSNAGAGIGSVTGCGAADAGSPVVGDENSACDAVICSETAASVDADAPALGTAALTGTVSGETLSVNNGSERQSETLARSLGLGANIMRNNLATCSGVCSGIFTSPVAS